MTVHQLQAKRAELRANGINLRALCAEHNVSYQAARDLLRGRLSGYRGEAHKAAVLLGLKAKPKKAA